MTGNSIYITGTDTGVGKTLFTGLLARFFAENEVSVVTQKWFQTGSSGFSEDIEEHLRIMGRPREDVDGLERKVAPYTLSFPASPHLAAVMDNVEIKLENVISSFNELKNKFDMVLVEGSGGFLVPVNDRKTSADIVEELNMPVMIVAENRLGAINQTLLTVEAVRKRNIPILGIVFNRVSDKGDDLILRDNLNIVEKISGVEVLGELPYNTNADEAYEHFRPIGCKIYEKTNTEKGEIS